MQMKIVAPEYCPECGSKLELVNAQLFCRNTNNCPAQNSKSLEHFCKKMKLKGFGEKTLEKLNLSGIPELFALDKETLVSTFGDKVGTKLDAELGKLKGVVSMAQLLSSLSIPLIGDVASEKATLGVTELANASLGGKAGENLESWKCSEQGKEIMALPWNFATTSGNTEVDYKTLGIAVSITGSLNNFKNRNDAKAYLENLGFTVKSSVTKEVKYLICEDESKRTSSSFLKAQNNGIEIGTIENLISKYTKE